MSAPVFPTRAPAFDPYRASRRASSCERRTTSPLVGRAGRRRDEGPRNRSRVPAREKLDLDFVRGGF